MANTKRVNFEFKNQVSPRYIRPLFLQLESNQWYASTDMQELLRQGGLDVQGKDIVQANMSFWAKVGLGEIQRQGPGRPNLFRLTAFGGEFAALYSTNEALFFDVMHYLFYSGWRRSRAIEQAPFWLYAQVCDRLWEEAPGRMHSTLLTGQLQRESRQAFPSHDPVFPDRSVTSIFPWLGALAPPFLSPCGSQSTLCSEKRNYCTPQLFHLAVDLVYALQKLNYDTSLAMDESQIRVISKICLLDETRFWEMASLADMAIRELEIRKGQWGTSLALTGPPRWIDLPTHHQSGEEPYESEDA